MGDGRAPVTTVVVLAGAAVAVIVGFAILRSVEEPADGGTATPAATGAAVAPSAPSTVASTSPTTTEPTTTTTTTPPARRTDATVVVANASGVGGSATAMATELETAGYRLAPVANAPGQRLDRSIIYYVDADPAAAGVAELLADQIPTAQRLPMPAEPPLDRPLGAATVALLLGLDAAGRTLAELATG